MCGVAKVHSPVFKVGREHPVAACLQNGSFPLMFDCSMFKKQMLWIAR
nr:MAG TPA: hypothetical protein [Podoviridae sp. ctY3D12]